ncbi:MAG: hypothetical protein JWO36_2175 [Myxococcales bacterium]|nr:hypothetical protein [Myxococcales bacterium]
MAQLRLIAVLALAACRQSAEAGPGSGITPPTGWRALPDLATAVTNAAKTEHVTVDGSEAWGEPAMGCYGAWFSMRGGSAAPDVMAQQVLDDLAPETERGRGIAPALAGIAIRDVVKPAAGADRGTLSLAFTRDKYRGRLRAQLDSTGRIAALACFWNEREPIACESACTGLVGRLP